MPKNPVCRFKYPGHSSSPSLTSRISRDSLFFPPRPSLKSEKIISIQFMLLFRQREFYFSSEGVSVYKPLTSSTKDSTADLNSRPEFSTSAGVTALPPNPKGPEFIRLLENQRATHLHLQRANAHGKWNSFECPFTCKTIKPAFYNLRKKRIASFVLFLAKGKSRPLSFP